MNFLSRDFLYHRGVSKTIYRGTWNRSNVYRNGSGTIACSRVMVGSGLASRAFVPSVSAPNQCYGSGSAILRMEKNFGSGLAVRIKIAAISDTSS